MIILHYKLLTLNIHRLRQQSIKWYPNRINHSESTYDTRIVEIWQIMEKKMILYNL